MTRHARFVLPLLPAILLLAVPAAVAEKDDAYDRIVDVVRKGLAEDRGAMLEIEPVFTFDVGKGHLIDWQLPTPHSYGAGFEDEDPLRPVFEAVVAIESLRAVFEKATGVKPVWKEPLAGLEADVRAALVAVVASDAGKEAEATAGLDEKIAKRLDELDAAVTGLEEGVVHLRVEEMPSMYEVAVVAIMTEPAGATLRVLPAWVLETWKATGLPEKRWPWRKIGPLDEVDGALAGAGDSLSIPVRRYAYRIEWPGGEKVEGVLEVRQVDLLITRAT